jgi:hypothetical protein
MLRPNETKETRLDVNIMSAILAGLRKTGL